MAAYAAALSLTMPSFAKTPGEVHCYNGICHRVKTVEEMQTLVGYDSEAVTSFYDTAERDSMNVGTITSSGEEFDADSDSHAASSLYPDGTELLVWNPKNRQAAHIRVNDFGPFYMLRTIDVTRGVAEKLEFSKTGVARLRVVVVWAPDPAAARFRRHRSYPAVEGYLGRLDTDQLYALKQRLIATGPARNGLDPLVVASTSARMALQLLPAYAPAGGKGTHIQQARAIILNTPRTLLGANAPQIALADAGSSRPLLASRTTRTLGSAQAMAAASQPPSTIVVARDDEVTLAIASLNTAALPAATVSPLWTSEPSRITSHEGSTTRAWAPNTLLWQQLLVALGILTLAGASWRTRSPTTRRQRLVSPLDGSHGGATASLGTAAGFPLTHGPTELREVATAIAQPAASPDPIEVGTPDAETLTAAANFAPIDTVIALPLLPRRPSAKTMDEWRSDAVGHMEAYAFGLAECAYRQLLAARVAALGDNDPMTASAERQLADCLREQGRYAAAEPHYRRALATMTLVAGDAHPATADILDEYAISLLKQGRGAEAERTARQALASRRTHSASSREYALTLSLVAETLRCQGQLPAAEATHRQAWAQFIALGGQDSLDAAASMTSIGTVLGELGRFGPAEELLNAGTRILSSICGPDHPASALGYALLGDLYRRAGALDAANTMQLHALQIRERTIGERHPDTIENVLTLALIATEQYRIDDARALLARALDNLIVGERNHLGPQSRIRSLLVALSHHHDTAQPLAVAAQ